MTKEESEQLLLQVRAERTAVKMEVRKTPAELAAEVDQSEFDDETRARLLALFKAGNYAEWGAAVGEARVALAERKA